MIVSDDVILSQ